MRIEVVHVTRGTTHTHVYDCKDASRQLEGSIANIVFKEGPGLDRVGRKVLTAQYSQASTVITYDED